MLLLKFLIFSFPKLFDSIATWEKKISGIQDCS